MPYLYCPKCGKQNKANFNFCVYCGTSLVDVNPPCDNPPEVESQPLKYPLSFLNGVIERMTDQSYPGEIVIPKTINGEAVTSIGPQAFFQCTRVSKIVFPEGLQRIENHACSYCELLDEVVIPNTVSFIGESAFECCSNLRRIVFPYSLKVIQRDTCCGCAHLDEVIIPASVKLIESNAFARFGYGGYIYPARMILQNKTTVFINKDFERAMKDAKRLIYQ